jgi:glycerol-3-phosphate dehydrogenase (NAD(P)+)
MERKIKTIGIVGGGAWGTALAAVAVRAGRQALVWAREPEVVDAINRAHENTMFLPGVALPEAVRASGDLAELAAADALLLVTPAQALRSVALELARFVRRAVPVAICAKGIERGTNKFLSEVLSESMQTALPLVLSGPSFAADVARGLPTAVTLAGRSHEAAREVAEALMTPSFRPYLSDDVIGAEIGGAVKNVLAIACGIAEGRRLGDSARAALIARAFAELTRFGRAFGARSETLTGLSGLGDLILTCSSRQSRNFTLGIALGEGKSAAEVLGARTSVSEGAYTAAAVVAIAEARGIEMPIAAAVNRILEGSAVETEIAQLLARPIKAETS